MGGNSGGGGRSGRSGGGGGGAELAAAEAEMKSLNDQLAAHNSRVPGEPSSLEKIMHPEIAAERTRLNEAWKLRDKELRTKYDAVSAKVESLKSPARLQKEAAAGEKAVKEMQERGYREARAKITETGIYKPPAPVKLTAEQKRIRRMLEHIDD